MSFTTVSERFDQFKTNLPSHLGPGSYSSDIDLKQKFSRNAPAFMSQQPKSPSYIIATYTPFCYENSMSSNISEILIKKNP